MRKKNTFICSVDWIRQKPVPSGLTVTTEFCNAFLEAGEEFPEGMWDQVLEGLKAVEA